MIVTCFVNVSSGTYRTVRAQIPLDRFLHLESMSEVIPRMEWNLCDCEFADTLILRASSLGTYVLPRVLRTMRRTRVFSWNLSDLRGHWHPI